AKPLLGERSFQVDDRGFVDVLGLSTTWSCFASSAPENSTSRTYMSSSCARSPGDARAAERTRQPPSVAAPGKRTCLRRATVGCVRKRWAVVATATLALLALAGPAQSAPRKASRPIDALRRAEALFHGSPFRPPVDATLELRDLALARDRLSPALRPRA